MNQNQLYHFANLLSIVCHFNIHLNITVQWLVLLQIEKVLGFILTLKYGYPDTSFPQPLYVNAAIILYYRP